MTRWILITLFLPVVLCSCGDNQHGPTAWHMGVRTVAAPTPNAQCGSEGPKFDPPPDDPKLAIDTYDGLGQVVHPDVLWRPELGRLYMAITPYPFGNDDFENPSVYVSKDGSEWRPPAGADNPLVETPANNGYNNDPDLVFDNDSNEFRIYYQATVTGHQQIVLLRSTNLANWSKTVVMDFYPGSGDVFTLSPSVVRVEGGYEMYVAIISNPNYIAKVRSADGITWDKADLTPINWTANFQPWHLDVQRDASGYTMLISGFQGADYLPQDLFWATSKDGTNWVARSEPVLSRSDFSAPMKSLYRSTFLPCNGNVTIWYSYRE